MENTEKIKKINIVYLMLNIFAPTAVFILAVALAVVLPENIGVILSIIGFAVPVIWWSFLSKKLYENTKKKNIQQLKGSGFTCNQTFNADNCTVVVDMNKAEVAIMFRWNPSKVYIRPANTLTDVRVDDGRSGAGIMEGSSRVSFLFKIEGIKIRVNTFISNKRWRMDSDYILKGISKADLMAQTLIEAGASKAEV